MILTFRQRIFSWLDSYDIFDEAGNTVFRVKGELSFGHLLRVYDAAGRELGHIQERILTFRPQFEVYRGGQYLGCIRKEITFFRPRFNIDYNGWQVDGDFWQWDYTIKDAYGNVICVMEKQLAFSDTYVINVVNEACALDAVMFALAMDAQKCSEN